MKGLETSKDKMEKICAALRKETLEPAKQEAREIIENARMQAASILAEAEKKAGSHLEAAEKEALERKRVFEASLQLACRQGIEGLKQKMEKELFEPELRSLISQEMKEPSAIARLLEAIVKALEEKGIDQELTAVIPKALSPRSVSALLARQILEKLESRVVNLGGFDGGVQIQLKEGNMTLDFSDTVVKELVAQYIRRDFRDLIFKV